MKPTYTMADFAHDLVMRHPTDPSRVAAALELGLSATGGSAFAMACLFLAPLDDEERKKVIALLGLTQRDPDLRAAAFLRSVNGSIDS